MSKRYLCIHGHFYQPPRENPWLEAIERQDSARPYHDWNERITAECYAPNAASRVLDGEGRIASIVNNYARISFNFGPTLLSWMEVHEPEVYERILEADRESVERLGHGSAMAQGFHHSILPLCNDRDLKTQVRWGARDFELRFGRRPEGMWLPEAAVDLRTLEALVDEGIAFTVLAPRQAKRVRQGRHHWRETHGGVDPRRAYRCNLPSGRSIALFFYDGPVSQAVAFEQLLQSGEKFHERLRSAFDASREEPQLVHIATDGETYGHHFRYGDMALSYALQLFDDDPDVELTNYATFLERHPPEWEVEIWEHSSWSCVHGVERWKADCGCNTGRPGWRQPWRAPLRAALDRLRDAVAPRFEQRAAELVEDPWAARDDYVDVTVRRSAESQAMFLKQHARRELSEAERIEVLELLELQRHAMLMYTSCGWFFDEVSGLETVQVMRYALRAMQLARDLFGLSPQDDFARALEEAPSNVPEIGSGRKAFEDFVVPSRVDLVQVAAHFAVSFPFEAYEARSAIYGYPVEVEQSSRMEAGRARLGVGRMRISSEVTGGAIRYEFGVVHLGDHNVYAGVREAGPDDRYRETERDLRDAFSRADLPVVIHRIDDHFPGGVFNVTSLFWDEQRRILDVLLKDSVQTAAGTYRALYEQNAPLMRFLSSMQQPLPAAFEAAAEIVLNDALREAILAGPDIERIRTLVTEAKGANVEVDVAGLGYAFTETLERIVDDLAEAPEDPERLERAVEAARFAASSPLQVDLWRPQNTWWRMRETLGPQRRSLGRWWNERFDGLGEALGLRV